MPIRTILSLPILLYMFAAPAQTEDRPPNIVFIMADDLGYHELGAFGQEKIRTPNLDRLADQGIKLTRHYAGSAVCAPTRSILMTGLHSGHATIRGNKPTPGGNWDPESPEGQWPIPDDDYTIAELLKERGYATAAFGKWGLGGPGSTGHPSNQGFDHFYGYLCQRVAHNYYPTHLWRNHDVDVLDGNDYFSSHQRIEEPLESEDDYDKRYRGESYAPTEINDALVRWLTTHIETKPDTPFFLYYPTIIPHVALQAPKEVVDSYPDEWDEKHYLGNRGYLPNATPRATYAAMVTYMDECVGRVLDLLDEQGLDDNTVVIFTSDNGSTYVSGVDREFFQLLGDLRGHKGQLYEGGIRMPTIVRWPGKVPPGTTSGDASYHPDWFPTIAEIVSAETPPNLDGTSLVRDLIHADHVLEREFMYWEFPEGPGSQALIFGDQMRWKLIRPRLKKEPDHHELYDLLNDPNETQNIADKHPELVEQALLTMQSQHTDSDLFPLEALDSP